MTNVSVLDYMEYTSNQTFMPLTMRFNANLTTCSIRSSFADLHEPDKQRVARPVPATPAGDGGDVWLPWEANDFHTWIAETARKDTGNASLEIISYRSFFTTVFEAPPPPVIYFAQGGQFAASRDAIRRTPRSKYAWVLRKIEEGHEELVYYMEVSPHGGGHEWTA